jgi:glycosyltransferase involved in cell wall biosynthesis
MPTRGRRDMAAAALDCWLKQDWPNKELIVVDDEDCRAFPNGLDMENVHYSLIKPGITLGAKRNLVCSLTHGDTIVHFDSDDFSTPDRITYQVSLLQSSPKMITGFGTLLFWDVLKQQAKRYKPTINNYICGTSFCYRKAFWHANQFKDKQVATDNGMIYPMMSHVLPSPETRYIVARIHSDHTSAKNGVKDIVSRDLIPAEFWENEKLRLSLS